MALYKGFYLLAYRLHNITVSTVVLNCCKGNRPRNSSEKDQLAAVPQC